MALNDRPRVDTRIRGENVQARGFGNGPGVRPPALNLENNSALRLAEAIGRNRPAVNRFLTMVGEDSEDKRAQEMEAAAFETLERYTPADVQGMIDRGEINEYQDPYYRAAIQRGLGIRAADDVYEGLVSDYEFDWVEGDFEAALSENADLDGKPDFYVAGYHEQMERRRAQLQARQDSARVEATEAAALDGYHTESLRLIERWKTGEISVEDMFVGFGEARDVLHVRGPAANTVLVDLARSFAEQGDPDTVEALLRTPRADGTPAISSIRGWGAETERLVATAKRLRDAALEQEKIVADWRVLEAMDQGRLTWPEIRNDPVYTDTQKEEFYRHWQSIQNRDDGDAERARLNAQRRSADTSLEFDALRALTVGEAAFLDDVEIELYNGTAYTARADAAIEAAVARQMGSILQRPEFGGYVPVEDDGYARLIDLQKQVIARNNGVLFREWEMQLSGSATNANLETIRTAAEVPENLSAAFRLYRALGVQLADDHIRDNPTKVFFAYADVAHSYGNRTPEQALQEAATAVVRGRTILAGEEYQAMRDAVDNVKLDHAFRVGPFEFGREDVSDWKSYAREWMIGRAQYLAMSTGMTVELAVTRAEDEFQERHVSVHGRPTVIPRGYNDRAGWESTAESFLAAFATDNAAALESRGIRSQALTLLSPDNGRTYVVALSRFEQAPMGAIEDGGMLGAVVSPSQMARRVDLWQRSQGQDLETTYRQAAGNAVYWDRLFDSLPVDPREPLPMNVQSPVEIQGFYSDVYREHYRALRAASEGATEPPQE